YTAVLAPAGGPPRSAAPSRAGPAIGHDGRPTGQRSRPPDRPTWADRTRPRENPDEWPDDDPASRHRRDQTANAGADRPPHPPRAFRRQPLPTVGGSCEHRASQTSPSRP